MKAVTSSKNAVTHSSVVKLIQATTAERDGSLTLLRAKSENLIRLSSRNLCGSQASQADSAALAKFSVFQIKQKTHEELDIEIQSARILYVLDELIEKLEIAAFIPAALENNGEILYKCLKMKDADFVMEACMPYVDAALESSETESHGSPRSRGSSYSGSQLINKVPQDSKIDETVVVLKTAKPDSGLQQAIAIICSSHKFKKMLRNLKHLSLELIALELIDGAKRLRDAAAKKLAVSANEERERERELRKAWKDNIEARVLIKGIQERLDKQKEELDVQLDAKDQLINYYTDKIEALKCKFKEDIKKRILDSEKSMIQRSQLSEDIQARLQQDAKEITHNYWALLDQHIASERVLRAKRYKIEAQLANWLAKYDQDMGERQTELEELQQKYDEENEELNTIQKKFDEQEEEYTILMEERDDYERKIYEEKAFIFLSNRAARRIQRYWKAYRERKRLRKKKKKGKKEKGSASGESGGDSAKKKSAGKDKKGKKGKKKGGKEKDFLTSKDDPNAKLETKFKGDVFDDINTDPIPQNVTVEL